MLTNNSLRRSTPSRVTGFEHLDITEDMLFANFSLLEFWNRQSTSEFSEMWFSTVSVCVLTIAFGLVTLFGTFGNIVMVYVVVRRQKLKSSRNLFILNIALCDIMTSVLCIPFTGVRLIMKHWPLGEMMCKVVPSLQAVYIFVSIFTIVMIAVDRYRAIVHCITKKQRRSRLIYVFPALWMFSLALALPLFVYHEVEDVYLSGSSRIFLFSSCRENWNDLSRLLYGSLILAILLIVPLAVLVTLHGLICRFIQTHIESKPSYSRELQRNRRQLLRQRKNIILLTSIAVSFAVMWIPLTLTNLLADINYQMFEGINFNWLIVVCHLLAMSSVCINPIIYGWFNSNFKREIKCILFRNNAIKTNLVDDNGDMCTELKSCRYSSRLIKHIKQPDTKSITN